MATVTKGGMVGRFDPPETIRVGLDQLAKLELDRQSTGKDDAPWTWPHWQDLRVMRAGRERDAFVTWRDRDTNALRVNLAQSFAQPVEFAGGQMARERAVHKALREALRPLDLVLRYGELHMPPGYGPGVAHMAGYLQLLGRELDDSDELVIVELKPYTQQVRLEVTSDTGYGTVYNGARFSLMVNPAPEATA